MGLGERVGLKPDLRVPRDGRDYAEHVRYCWINPVKHGLVGHPREWPFSSWHRDAGGAVWLGGA